MQDAQTRNTTPCKPSTTPHPVVLVGPYYFSITAVNNSNNIITRLTGTLEREIE
jgi:hypothetical protein